MAWADLRSSPYGDAQFTGMSMGYGAGGGCGGKGEGGSMYREKAPSDNLYVSGLPMGADENFVRTLFGQYAPVQQCRVMPSKIVGANHCTALVRFASVAEATAVRDATQGGTVQGATEPLQVMFSATQPRGVVGEGACGSGWRESAPAMSSWQGGGKSWFGGKGKKASYKDSGHYGNSGSYNNSGRAPMDSVAKHFQQAKIIPGSDGAGEHNCLHVSGLPADCDDVHLYRIFSAFGAITPHGATALKYPDGTCKGFGLVSYIDAVSMQEAQRTMDGQQLPDGTELKVTIGGQQQSQQQQQLEAPQPQVTQESYQPY
eukprot:TRINITY_DN3207_c0_g1_i1.p1 TRINITY_DN3207_c0_g1~~TRINITY_DN3207_c0_g1_i1.p1  ORF type:complete len:316 (-),score=53.36 TRINITY_DN3207_c0_g1_i1:241-1188(-)